MRWASVATMLVRFIKNSPSAEADALSCVRPDGSATTSELRRQGILPHEAIHFVVEDQLGWHDAFFGHIARGETIEQATNRLHGRNARWTKITQALQSEALVESFENDQWAGASDPAKFAENLVAGCRRRGVLPPDITAEELENVRVALRAFGATWRPLAPGASLERTFRT
jgi:hypothetical protein